MSEAINLDRDHREVVRGIVKDSSVLCSATSAPDVYVHVITAKDTAELHKGDGTVVLFHVFRVNSGNDPFSATVVVTDLPASATEKSNMLLTAFSLIKHKPKGLKIKSAKRAKKAVKKAAKRKTRSK